MQYVVCIGGFGAGVAVTRRLWCLSVDERQEAEAKAEAEGRGSEGRGGEGVPAVAQYAGAAAFGAEDVCCRSGVGAGAGEGGVGGEAYSAYILA